MNLRHTVELAALVSKQSDQVIETPQQLPESAIQDFWVHSQRPLFDWMRQLVRYPVEIKSSSSVGRGRIWRRTESLLVNFFVSDVLARVWSAVLTAADLRQLCVSAVHKFLSGGPQFPQRGADRSLRVRGVTTGSIRGASGSGSNDTDGVR